ncbi:MerR family transcriptional regulator [Streptomyces sp. NPDC048441]|uniref:MerR family transcriptional regulator n=1 Tax=Streptomyces sp. NPDC048441 TaxID=3365552 RepID=UPI003719C92F
MRIGELSRRTGVGTHQLRYYEAQGLLAPERGSNGYREYASDSVAKVRQIRNLLGAGLSTQDIASLLPCVLGEAPDFVSCPEMLTLMQSRRQRLDARIETLTHSREALRGYIDRTENHATTTAGDRPWDGIGALQPGF